MSAVIEDVQNREDTRKIPINKVGIKDIRHPLRVRDRSMGEQHTIACFNMYVNLPHNFKGTHMSRFVEILNQHEREISVESFKEMLREMADRLEADSGHIEIRPQRRHGYPAVGQGGIVRKRISIFLQTASLQPIIFDPPGICSLLIYIRIPVAALVCDAHSLNIFGR